MSKNIRVLVCGGRDYDDGQNVWEVLDEVHSLYGIALLITGAAPGADSLAEEWAKERELPYVGVPARWKEHGRGAGHIRNQNMLEQWRPNLVVAFSGNRGTQNMVERSLRANVRVLNA